MNLTNVATENLTKVLRVLNKTIAEKQANPQTIEVWTIQELEDLVVEFTNEIARKGVVK